MATPADTTALAHPRSARGNAREVLALAYPVVLSNLSMALLQLVDAAFVGRLGATELGAVGFGGVWYWTALCFFIGTAQGVQTFVSQAQGAGRERECGAWVWQSLWWSAPAAALALGVFSVGFGPLAELLGPSPELREAATAYVHPRAFGAGAAAAGMALASFFRGIGDTRTPLYAVIAANAINAALCYGLVFGRLGLPAWGVAGAGAATAVAEWAQLAILLAAFLRAGVARRFATRPVRPRRRAVVRLARTSLPIGGQWLLEMTSFALFTALVARMGDRAMAASQAFLALQHLSFMQVLGVSIAAGTLVGRYLGARDLEAAERSLASSLRLGLVAAVAVGALFLAVPEALLRLFTQDASVLSAGRSLLAVGAVFGVFDAVAITCSGALRGAGDTRWPFVVQTLLAWLLFLPLAWLGGVALAGGLVGAWVGGALYVAVLALVLLRRFRSGAWQRISI